MSCPICDKDSDPKYKPFCSRRCADVDLGRWMSETYAIPTEEEAPTQAQTEDSKAVDTTRH
ncbi:DNA gyrase inhibitor YacG [Halovulum sp. GXIMD14793]